MFDILGSSLAASEKKADTENPVDNSETSPLENNDDPESTQEDITQLLEHVRTGNEDEKRVATEELAKLVVSHDEIRAHIVEEGILPRWSTFFAPERTGRSPGPRMLWWKSQL